MVGVRPGLDTRPHADELPHRSGGSRSGQSQSSLPVRGCGVVVRMEGVRPTLGDSYPPGVIASPVMADRISHQRSIKSLH